MLDVTNYRYEAQKSCPVVYKVDQQDLQQIIQNKFKIIDISQDFIFPYQIKPYKKNIYKKIKHFEYMPSKVFKRLSKKIGEHMLVCLKKI